MFRQFARFIVVAAGMAAACTSTTDGGDADIDLVGVWTYAATESASSARLEGTLVIDEQGGTVFSGQFNGRVRDADGMVSDLDGIVSGRAFGGQAIDFDLFLNGTERRHVGKIANDGSIAGSWAQQSGAASFSGSFSLRRRP